MNNIVTEKCNLYAEACLDNSGLWNILKLTKLTTIMVNIEQTTYKKKIIKINIFGLHW